MSANATTSRALVRQAFLELYIFRILCRSYWGRHTVSRAPPLGVHSLRVFHKLYQLLSGMDAGLRVDVARVRSNRVVRHG